jgi:pimeloyl-ACP methyl ester carboxylesterase
VFAESEAGQRASRQRLPHTNKTFFFQLPWLPEVVSRWRNWRLLTSMMRSSSLPGTFTDADMAEYRQAWSQPGAYVGMLSWYRAMMRTRTTRTRRPQHAARSAQEEPSPRGVNEDAQAEPRSGMPARQPISVPTLLLWGAQDRFLGRDLAEKSIKKCRQGQLVFLRDATHWLHHEQPERVNALIQEFVQPRAMAA